MEHRTGYPAGFTVAYCRGPRCPGAAGGVEPAAVGESLRRTVRRCPHGVLVATECLTGACRHGDAAGAGGFVVVQPCDEARTPVGTAAVTGPMHEEADVADLCAWLREGARGRPPMHLHVGPAVLAAGPTDP